MSIIRKEVPVDSIFPNPWNPNTQSPFIFDKVKKSIKEFGFVDPILVRELKDETYEIIGGEHRWKAAKELGFTMLPVDCMGKIDDAKAKAMCVLANLHGQEDSVRVAKLVKTLTSEQQTLLPYDQEYLDQLSKMLDFDFEQFNNAKVPDKKTEATQKLMQTAIHFEKAAREAHTLSEDVSFRTFLEVTFDWTKKLRQLIDEAKD